MDDFRNKREKLVGLKKKIILMPNSMARARLIDAYDYMLFYANETGAVKNKEYNNYTIDDMFKTKYQRFLFKETREKINEIYSISDYLYNQFDQIIKCYQENNFYVFDVVGNYGVNTIELLEDVKEFFKMLGDDIYYLYKEMCENNNIALKRIDNCNGMCINTTAIDNPCIIAIDADKSLLYYTALVHEMGHAYQYHLQRNQHNFAAFSPFAETTSQLLETLFLEFLKDKGQYPKQVNLYELYCNTTNFLLFSVAKTLCDFMRNGKIENVDPYNLSYYPESLTYEVAANAIKECSFIPKNTLNYTFDELHYGIGEVIGAYFRKEMKKDFTNTWKEYKDFICMSNNYTMKEIINKYFDVEIKKDEIKTFMKSYQNR